ncbi:MAG: hypothetical protein E7450_05595 [Ruminococcaceae bacterium]|nr:hypothetical protein [Oscillospiraceae bacterium]
MNRMRPTLDQLMEYIGATDWPQRWRDLYDAAMDDFERNGCPFTAPDYYTKLHEELGIFPKELPLYQRAAAETAGDEKLSRILHLLCTALNQPEHNAADCEGFKFPLPPDVEPYLPRDMLQALALCSQIPRCVASLRRRGLPEDLIRTELEPFERVIDIYRDYHNGQEGFHLLSWYHRTISGNLIRLGRLELEMNYPFTGTVKVFRNKQGDIVDLAHDLAVHREGMALGARYFEDEEGSWQADVVETDTHWEGYPFDETGRVKKELVRLDKLEWAPVLQKGDTVVQLHIPASGKLDMAAVEDSLQQMRDFLAAYYPDYEYKAFACASWLLNPVLADLIGKESNIVRFGRLFRPLTMKAHGNGVFYFIFKIPNNNFDLPSLPESTRLEKALKDYYLSGHAVHETNGYFF